MPPSDTLFFLKFQCHQWMKRPLWLVPKYSLHLTNIEGWSGTQEREDMHEQRHMRSSKELSLHCATLSLLCAAPICSLVLLECWVRERDIQMKY